MLNCDKFKMQFSDYLDSELPQTQRKEVDLHLSNCPGCSEILKQMKRIQQSMNQLQLISTSADFERKLHAQIFENPLKSNFIPFPWQNWKVPAMGTALVLASISFFLVFNQSSDNIIQNRSNIIPESAVPIISSKIKRPVEAVSTQSQSTNKNQSSFVRDSLEVDSLRQFNNEGLQLINEK